MWEFQEEFLEDNLENFWENSWENSRRYSWKSFWRNYWVIPGEIHGRFQEKSLGNAGRLHGKPNTTGFVLLPLPVTIDGDILEVEEEFSCIGSYWWLRTMSAVKYESAPLQWCIGGSRVCYGISRRRRELKIFTFAPNVPVKAALIPWLGVYLLTRLYWKLSVITIQYSSLSQKYCISCAVHYCPRCWTAKWVLS